VKVNHCFDLVLAVKDHDAACRKYAQLLGMEPVHLAPESLPGDMHCSIFIMWNLPDRGMVFSIVSSGDPGHQINQHIAKKGEGLYLIGFEADDLAPIAAQARAAGVRFVNETPMPYDYGQLMFCDSDTTDTLPIFFASHKQGWWAQVLRAGR
jgi:catechol 2,3-dioxygenase-like lactoylglutathione lyase family enzyme